MIVVEVLFKDATFHQVLRITDIHFQITKHITSDLESKIKENIL